jgi:GTP-binding protein EngB required for normal cell division
VATKADKLSNNKLNKSLENIREVMPGCRVLPYSSATGKGKPSVWGAIEEAVG